MARKEQTVVIDAEGRDKNKVFHIREMSASAAEDWAMRALLALGRSGADIPADVEHTGMAGVAALGLRALAGVKTDDARQLAADLMACISIIPDPQRPNVQRPLLEDDIEEVKTRVTLKDSVFELHTGFSVAAAISKSRKASAQESSSSNTSTSLESSGQ